MAVPDEYRNVPNFTAASSFWKQHSGIQCDVQGCCDAGCGIHMLHFTALTINNCCQGVKSRTKWAKPSLYYCDTLLQSIKLPFKLQYTSGSGWVGGRYQVAVEGVTWFGHGWVTPWDHQVTAACRNSVPQPQLLIQGVQENEELLPAVPPLDKLSFFATPFRGSAGGWEVDDHHLDLVN